jgi:uncharacterized SAM-binding protein YcdF (DUF218 family)
VDQAYVGLIGRCFFPRDHPGKSDVAIVFGMNDPRRPARRAAELFHAGMVRKLLFTGGYNKWLGQSEAHEMARLARQDGVPEAAMLIEDQARNTDDNIKLSSRLLDDRVGLDSVASVTLVTIHYHLRRAHLAARRQFPAEVALRWTCYASLHYTSENWFDVEQGRRDVMTEISKIERYYGLTLKDLLGLQQP